MQRWTEHVKAVTGRYPAVPTPDQVIDLTVIDLEPRDQDTRFGAGRSFDVTIPGHLLAGGRDSSGADEWVAFADR